MFKPGVLDAMRIGFDYSGGLVTSEVIVETRYGFTPLLSYCCGGVYNAGPTIEGFSFLRNRGANVSARYYEGNSCLHLCLISVKSEAGFKSSGAQTAREFLERVRFSLGYLIQHGAEVSAINNNGVSVSNIAYEDNLRGHLWDMILADCRFDIAAFRTAEHSWHPCPVQRTKGGSTLAQLYTKEVFMSLWKGKEHLCPYYDEVIRTGFDDRLHLDYESDSGEDDSNDSDDDSSDEVCHYCESGSDDGADKRGDGSGNDRGNDRIDDESDEESDDDGGCMLDGA